MSWSGWLFHGQGDNNATKVPHDKDENENENENEPYLLGGNSDYTGAPTNASTTHSQFQDPEEDAPSPEQAASAAALAKQDKQDEQDNNKNANPNDGDDDEARRKQEQDSNVRLRDVLTDWSGNTSIHGIPWMANYDSNATWYRLLWAILSLGGAAGMCWQIQFLVRQYKDYQVVVDVRSFYPSTIEMPQVTVCNMNMFLKSQQERLNILEPRNDNEFRALTLDLDQFIFDTVFNDESVQNPSDFWHESLTSMGRCWDFRTDQGVQLPGIDGGLGFDVKLHQNDYTEDSVYGGVSVFVTRPGTQVNRQMYPIIAKPGRVTSISIQQTLFKRETKQPWSRCRGKSALDSLVQCREECINDWAIESCDDCKLLGDNKNSDDLKYCTSGEVIECQKRSNITTDSIAICNDQCQPGCRETLYRLGSLELTTSLVALERLPLRYNLTLEEIQTEWAQVHVNFEAITYDQQEERPSLSFNDLLAQIGGSMGLFLGISVLSFVELFFDLLSIRLIPRMCGVRHLYGIGGKNVLKPKSD